MTFHNRIFVVLSFEVVWPQRPRRPRKEPSEYFQQLHFWNQFVPLIKMHYRVRYSFDFNLKIRSGQVWDNCCVFSGTQWSHLLGFFPVWGSWYFLVLCLTIIVLCERRFSSVEASWQFFFKSFATIITFVVLFSSFLRKLMLPCSIFDPNQDISPV